jgi:CreA protein
MIVGAGILLVIVLFGWWFFSRPERGTTGLINTHFRWLGPNDKIVVDGFDDPKVQGVACHISRAQTGGVKGAFPKNFWSSCSSVGGFSAAPNAGRPD